MKRSVKNSWSFANFKRGPLMSVVGIGLMLLSVYVYLMRADSEMFALTLLGLGALALGLKDPRVPPKTGAGVLMLIALLFLMSSCCGFKKCAQKYGTGETHTITLRDTVHLIDTVYIEPDSVIGSTPIQPILQGDTVTDNSASSNIQIKFWFDKYNNLLKYSAKVKPDTVYKDRLIPIQIEGDCPDTLILDPEKGASGIARLWERVKSFSVWLLLLFIVGMIMLGKWKKIKSYER